MSTTAEKIAVMQEQIKVMLASDEGAIIQGKLKSVSNIDWFTLSPTAENDWNWEDYDFRVKPEPLTLWVVEYPNGGIGIMYYTDEASAKRGMGKSGCRLIKLQEVPE